MNQELFEKQMRDCTLCPRNCHADRLHGRTGFCGVDAKLRVARAALHFWEEPCVSGSVGSGAVFFSGCNLKCVFCQNHSIAEGAVGKEISILRLAEIFLELQEKGAQNINLVTATHYAPQVALALERAFADGLKIPVVYNTSGYEKPETLRCFDGLVDIYLPDFKYMDAETAGKYSAAPDYPEVAKLALAEMVRQVGKPVFSERKRFFEVNTKRQIEKKLMSQMGVNATADSMDWTGENMFIESSDVSDEQEGELRMARGVIVRHLVLPRKTKESKRVIRYLYEMYGDQIFISILNQYTPMPGMERYPELNRKVTRREYDAVVDYAISIGVENGFIQEGDVAKESFIPAFDLTGV